MAKLQAFYTEATTQVAAMQAALGDAKARLRRAATHRCPTSVMLTLSHEQSIFKRAVEYFGEDGEALDPARSGGSEPERFFTKLNGFLQALRKARDDRQRVEHCLAADAAAASLSSPAPRSGEQHGEPRTPSDAPRPPELKMRSAPGPMRGETES